MPNSLPLLAQVAPLLQTQTFGHLARGFTSTTSTNIRASEWAAEGAFEGSMVVAEFQTAGRGRLQRSWQAVAGQNLMVSLILRPKLAPEQWGLITLASSLAVAEAITPFVTPLMPSIKWPNDVLLHGHKCCGILLERSTSPPQNQQVVILGIGLNVNQDHFPSALPDATSLLLETGRHIPRAPLLAHLLLAFEQHYISLTQDGGQRVREQYKRRVLGLGQTLTIHQTGTQRTVHGVFTDISPTGALILQTSEGLHTFHAGEISLRPTTSVSQ